MEGLSIFDIRDVKLIINGYQHSLKSWRKSRSFWKFLKVFAHLLVVAYINVWKFHSHPQENLQTSSLKKEIIVCLLDELLLVERSFYSIQ